MARRDVPAGMLLRAVFTYTAPALIVIGALVAFDRLGIVDAILAGVTATAALVVLVRRHLGDLAALSGHADRLVGDGDAAPPVMAAPEMMPDLPGALHRLQLAWLRRRERLERTASAAEWLLDNHPGPVIALDRQRRVVRATARARELMGADMIGRDLAAALRDPTVLEAADRVLSRGGEEDVAFSVPMPTERTFNAQIVAPGRLAADGTCAIVALYDLTAMMRAEQTRVDFVANASHELRTPLSVLLGCIKTLRGSARKDEEAQARFLDMMEAQSERMSRLVEDLLSLSRIELNEHTLPTEQVDVTGLIGKVADSLSFPARERDIHVSVESTLDVQPVTGDAEELTQLFQNLIDNAIKYGRNKSTVHIDVRMADTPARNKNGDMISVAITDEGEGIPAAHIPRLTERFYRVDTARSREMGGTGLGLAIVKHVLNRHRGTLNIDSRPGDGTTFTVLLPAAPLAPVSNSSQAGLPLGPGAHG